MIGKKTLGQCEVDQGTWERLGPRGVSRYLFRNGCPMSQIKAIVMYRIMTDYCDNDCYMGKLLSGPGGCSIRNLFTDDSRVSCRARLRSSNVAGSPTTSQRLLHSNSQSLSTLISLCPFGRIIITEIYNCQQESTRSALHIPIRVETTRFE